MQRKQKKRRGGMSNLRTNFEKSEAPVFTTYKEYHQTAVTSLENISIVMDIDGKVIFISQNVLPLLGHRPEYIVGKTLLNIIPDEQKDEISQKIILHLPLANAVGSLVEFCCWVRKGNAYRNAQQRHAGRGKYKKTKMYAYVKFILHLQNYYDESFIVWRKYVPNSRNIRSSAPRLLEEQQYYLVGTITVLRKQPESEHPTEIQSNVTVVDSDDDSTVQHRRLEKRRQKNDLQRICQDEAANMEHPNSDSKVEIMDIQPATRQRPLGTNQTRTSAPLSTRRNISATTSKSTGSGQKCTTDSNNMDMELEVPPEILLNDSQEEGSPEQERSRDEDENKSLEEAKTSNSKEQNIDEMIVLSSSSSYEYYCEITEDTEDKKNVKTLETVVGQGQGHQKAAKTASTIPNTNTQHVRPVAVVEPTVHIDQSASGVTENPLLRQRVAVLNTPRIRTQVYDLTITRTFDEEEIREREQCIYELAQRIEMLRGLYDPPQTGRGQANRACRPREQMVTAINDVGRGPINSYGNDNSEHPQNQTNRHSRDPVDCTPLLRPHPSTRSHQIMTVPHQPLATTGYPPSESQYSSARPQDPPTLSHHASSDYLRETRQPGQGNSAYSLTEENTINPHP